MSAVLNTQPSPPTERIILEDQEILEPRAIVRQKLSNNLFSRAATQRLSD